MADPGKKGWFLVREPDGDSIVGAEIRECGGAKLCSELIHEYLRPEIPALGNDCGQ